MPFLALKAITDIVDGERPAQEEFLENLHMAAQALQVGYEVLHACKHFLSVGGYTLCQGFRSMCYVWLWNMWFRQLGDGILVSVDAQDVISPVLEFVAGKPIKDL